MAYEIYLKKGLQNEIAIYLEHLSQPDPAVSKKIEVPTLNINNGLLKLGIYQIPLENILFIKEIEP
jgi:hypothetical protein